ncbi:RluA family pseudouridine synthase [Neorhodopirellula pilleata]|uniref:Ribosomal large subunit pseudouridine synthase A n=1 Tax=Neorhodopirellula pilleata TaxID=2714738 RepID=A0A5C6AV58_9BACT|nr:RluA family pseudouridine synthase [Neorhodopirellula pilleata]TWU03620.1 Ribosomal large subunit pseudouridine synthase A [Neorhodopirellula pilleata]
MNIDRMKLDVLYEDNHLLVVNKPSGLSTMGDAGRPTLHGLAADYLKRKYSKPHGVYVGIVSRLDAMTSGVIVLARTSKAAARLNIQFATKAKIAGDPHANVSQATTDTLRKSYLCIVRPEPNLMVGRPSLSVSGHLQDYLYKDDAAHRMRACEHPRPDAKASELQFEIIEHRGEDLLMTVVPLTGRKHQIRVQFASRGYPILGDRKYGSSATWAEGIALHSHRLTIQHPTRHESMTFTCPPPDSWNVCFENTP